MAMVGCLTAGSARELNLLHATIIATANRLTGLLDERDPRAAPVQDILHAAQRAARLTRMLLTAASESTAVPRRVELNTIVRDAEPLLRCLLRDDDRLALHLAPDPWTVAAEGQSLQRILLLMALWCCDARGASRTVSIETENRMPTLVPTTGAIAPSCDERVVLRVRADASRSAAPAPRPSGFEPKMNSNVVERQLHLWGGTFRILRCSAMERACEITLPRLPVERRAA